MRILLTGGTGFVGRHLTAQLLERGHTVIVVTRRRQRMNHSRSQKLIILEADLCERTAWWHRTPEMNDIDVLIHAAACLDYFGNRRRLHRVNVMGTLHALRNVVDIPGVQKIVFLSSIEAMGPIAEINIPADETARCAPVSPYGDSKLQAEKIIEQFGRERFIPYVILRLGNVYGPGGPSFVLPIAEALTEGRKNVLMRYLPAYQARYIHPVYIADASRGIIAALESSAAAGTYILAGESYMKIQDLYRMIARQMHVEFNPDEGAPDSQRYLQLRNGLRRLLNRADTLAYFTAACNARIHRAYSISKIRRELGFAPAISLEEGIMNALAWARDMKRPGGAH